MRSAIKKNSVASSWHFISTYDLHVCLFTSISKHNGNALPKNWDGL